MPSGELEYNTCGRTIGHVADEARTIGRCRTDRPRRVGPTDNEVGVEPPPRIGRRTDDVELARYAHARRPDQRDLSIGEQPVVAVDDGAQARSAKLRR